MIITLYKSIGLGLRFVLVTDLHDLKYGNLVQLIKTQKPDAILLAGDILERMGEYSDLAEEWQAKVNGHNLFKDFLNRSIDILSDRNLSRSYFGTEFLRKVSTIAPTFYSLGNHEWCFSDKDYSLFKECGITVLDNADVEVIIKGKMIRFGGLSTRFDLKWLREYSKKAGYKILLCHHPEYYRKMIMNTEIDTFDLVLGGHYHGGQWRVFNRAVFVPRIGFMMSDMVGQFDKLIISAGVVNTSNLPRFGNPCELVVIDT